MKLTAQSISYLAYIMSTLCLLKVKSAKGDEQQTLAVNSYRHTLFLQTGSTRMPGSCFLKRHKLMTLFWPGVSLMKRDWCSSCARRSQWSMSLYSDV